MVGLNMWSCYLKCSLECKIKYFLQMMIVTPVLCQILPIQIYHFTKSGWISIVLFPLL